MYGTDNYKHFGFLGTVRNEDGQWTYSHSRKSSFPSTDRKVVSFVWLLNNIESLPPEIHFYHEGRCGKCGRKLTHPESIETGYGPECYSRMSDSEKDAVLNKLMEQYIFNTEGSSES